MIITRIKPLGLNRDFKGVWIPKEIWLNKDLTIMEKLFLIEIDSLDNEFGCVASNAHFSEFFDVTKTRCSQIIKSLEAKGYIEIELKWKNKVIDQRVLGVCNKLKGGMKKIKGGYEENVEGSNTLKPLAIHKDINPCANELHSDESVQIDTPPSQPKEYPELDELFNRLWEAWPTKKNKKRARSLFNNLLKKKRAPAEFVGMLREDIAKRLASNQLGFDKLHITTYLSGERWTDEVTRNESNQRTNQQSFADRADAEARAAVQFIQNENGDDEVVANYEHDLRRTVGE